MNELKLTIELGEEDRELLTGIWTGVAHIACVLDDIRSAQGTEGTPFQLPPNVQPTPVEPEPAEAPAAETAEALAEVAEQTYTLEDLRNRVLKLIRAGKRDATNDIIHEYAGKVSAIPADKYAEVMAKLAEIR